MSKGRPLWGALHCVDLSVNDVVVGDYGAR
jgi:hypothetical protein